MKRSNDGWFTPTICAGIFRGKNVAKGKNWPLPYHEMKQAAGASTLSLFNIQHLFI